MAGKKSFEEGKALDEALIAFWHSGFEGTSYTDLEAATGLKKSSLYNAFGNKSALYEKCLERFETNYQTSLKKGLSGPKLRDVLVAYFEELFAHYSDSEVPCGSLATMESLKNQGFEGAAKEFEKSEMDHLMDLLQQRIDKAVKDEELPQNTDTTALASLFFVITRGLAVLNRNDQQIKILRDALSASLMVLENPPRNTS